MLAWLGVTGCSPSAPKPEPADETGCLARETLPQPEIVSRFEDGGPEAERVEGPFRVIVPEDYAALAPLVMAVLPDCEEALEAFMGHCRPWREGIVHYGRFDESRAKVEGGVVYIGKSDPLLTNLAKPSSWPGPPAICGGQGTLAHESVHTFQPEQLPAWLKEGWADYFSKIVVGGSSYSCGETELCITPPNPSGRPGSEGCVNPVEYWDLSDPDWGGQRPPEGEERPPASGGSNKSRYYKTGTCFWQTLLEAFGQDAIHQVLRAMHEQPRDDLPVFPFALETNRLLIRTYFEPVMGATVWEHIARFGIHP